MSNSYPKIDLNNLDPEIIKQLESINDVDLNKIKGLNKEYNPEHLEDTQNSQKLLKCAHEIIFTITAKVMEENAKGEIVGDKEICVKNYHIPVPIDKEYKDYMNTFFDYLESKIIQGIDHTNKEAKDKE